MGWPKRGEYGVAMGCPNFEFLLGIGLNLGCILKLGWPSVHLIGDTYYAFAPTTRKFIISGFT